MKKIFAALLAVLVLAGCSGKANTPQSTLDPNYKQTNASLLHHAEIVVKDMGTIKVELDEGADALKEGTGQLKTGSSTLVDGVSELLGGAKELKDGMSKFDKEGIQVLSKLLEDDAEVLIERLKTVQEMSSEYTSFEGDADMPSSVRFIIRTESI